MLESIKKKMPGAHEGGGRGLAKHTHSAPAYAHVTAHLYGDKHLKRGHLWRPTLSHRAAAIHQRSMALVKKKTNKTKHGRLRLQQLARSLTSTIAKREPPERAAPRPEGHYAPSKWITPCCHNVFTKPSGSGLCGTLLSSPAKPK